MEQKLCVVLLLFVSPCPTLPMYSTYYVLLVDSGHGTWSFPSCQAACTQVGNCVLTFYFHPLRRAGIACRLCSGWFRTWWPICRLHLLKRLSSTRVTRVNSRDLSTYLLPTYYYVLVLGIHVLHTLPP